MEESTQKGLEEDIFLTRREEKQRVEKLRVEKLGEDKV